MAHMYWALRCASDDCEQIKCVAYIGDVSPQQRFALPIDPEELFDVTCFECGNVHTYKAASFEAIQQDQPPDDQFENWFQV